MMADKGLPAVDALLSVAVGLELVGGILVLLGLYARWGALALLAFLVPVTLIMHNFWTLPEAEAMKQMINFMKNVSIAGGLLMVLALGAGPLSIDALRQKPPVPPPRCPLKGPTDRAIVRRGHRVRRRLGPGCAGDWPGFRALAAGRNRLERRGGRPGIIGRRSRCSPCCG